VDEPRFVQEHQTVEEGLRSDLKGTHSLLDAARDEITNLKEQLAVSKSREETLNQARAALDEKCLQQQRELERKAIRISELEEQINRLQQQIRQLEQAAEDKAEAHMRELEFLRAELNAKIKAADETADSSRSALLAELARCKEEAALLTAEMAAANVTIEELREANNKLRGQISAEETAHTRTQGELDSVKRELSELQLKLQRSQVTIDDKNAQIRKLEEKMLQAQCLYSSVCILVCAGTVFVF
jgi:chromosome segregation ATPase